MKGESLDLVLRDEATRSALTLSLLQVGAREAQLGGAAVIPELQVPISTSLTLLAETDLLLGPAIPNEGVFAIADADGTEEFTYTMRSFDTAGRYNLWDATLSSQQSGAEYRAFVIEDPIPLVIVPIAGAVAGIVWLWRRHKNQDKSAIETMQQTVKNGIEQGRPIDIDYDAESEVTLPLGVHLKAKSRWRVNIGARPAA